MTLITFEDGKPLMKEDGKIGTGQECCCDPCVICPLCSSACLEVVLSGWAGELLPCDCADLNGTYTLTRGPGFPPTVTAEVIDAIGTGAVLAVVLGFNAAKGTYFIESVDVVEPGSDYSDDAYIEITIEDGAVSCSDVPALSITTNRIEPAYTTFDDSILSQQGLAGSGATFSTTWVPVNTTPGAETWGISAVSVTNGGTLYQEFAQLKLLLTTPAELASEVVAFDGFGAIEHSIPVIDEFLLLDGFCVPVAGSGATFSAVWEIDDVTTSFYADQGVDGRHWYIDSLTITNGGTGYQVGQPILFTLLGTHYSGIVPQTGLVCGATNVSLVDTIDGTGAITAINAAFSSGPWYRSDGNIDFVVVEEPGEYFRKSGVISVLVDNPGQIAPVAVEGGTGANSCTYSVCDLVYCDEEEAELSCRKISVTLGDPDHEFSVEIDGNVIASGTITAEGNSCEEMTFSPGDMVTDCGTAGSAAVSAGTCGEGADEEACCQEECVCPGGCVDGLQVSLGNAPECFSGFYSDFLPCTSGGISASMSCNDGQWLVFVSVCCFENEGLCFASYEAVLECESDNLPPAGAVTLTETGFFEEGGGCPSLPPIVTIIK